MISDKQQEILRTASMRPVARWAIESRLFKSFDALVRRGHLARQDDGWYEITASGREAIR